jgi:hypothetical protein
MKASTYNVETGQWELNDAKSIKDELTGIVDPSTAPTLGETANASSTLPANTYYVVYTWVNQHGETYFSPEANFTTSAGHQLDVTLPTFPSNATSANVYISTVSGEETKQGSTATTTYTQASALVVGTVLPIENTSDHTVTPNEIGVLSDLQTTDKTSLVNSINEGMAKVFYQTSTLPSTPSNGWIRQLTADYTTPNGQSFKAGDIVVYIDSVNEWRFLVDVLNELQTISIPHGLSVIETDQKTPLEIAMDGRTLVNHSPLFDSGLWSKHANLTTNSPTKVSFTTDGVEKSVADIYIVLKPSTTYTVKTILGGGAKQINIVEYKKDGSTFVHGYEIDGEKTFTTTADIRDLRLQMVVKNTTGEVATFENVMLNEGSTAQEFVANVKHIKNPVFTSYGKNLLPSFNEWTLHANATVIEPYKLELNATAASQMSTVYIDCIAGQAYTLSHVDVSSSYYYLIYDGDTGTLLGHTGSKASITVTPSQTKLKVQTQNTTSGTFTFTNPQLELGSVATTFEVQNKTYLYGAYDSNENPISLGSNLDGSVADKLYYDNGWNVLKRWEKDVVLDGSFTWAFHGDRTGHKVAKVTFESLSKPSPKLNDLESFKTVKYDGKILRNDTSTSTGEDVTVVSVDGGNSKDTIFLTIPDTDSGWTEAMTPTANFIKGYFNGWKYTGDGTTHSWAQINDATVTSTSDTFVADPANSHADWTPYESSYQLADAVVEPVTMEGALNLIDGLNQVSLEEGVIVRELAKFEEGSTSWLSNFNSVSHTNYSVLKYLAVYENGKEFHKWTSDDTSGNGKRLIISKADYDQTAQYTVTYLVLDKHLFTSNAISAQITYNTNLKTVVDKNVDKIAKLTTKQSIQDIWNQDVAVKGEGEKVQKGSNSQSTTGAGVSSLRTITFPKAFKEAPIVLVHFHTGAEGGYVTIRVHSATTTGCTIRFTSYTASTYEYNWVAIGK